MTDYDMALSVRKLILNTVAQVLAYPDHWSVDLVFKEIYRLREKPSWFTPINANNLTEQELKDLGFGRWTEETKLYLIPLWIKPYLQDDIDAECINGDKYTKVSAMDDDNRMGMLAYGVTPKEA